MVDVRGLDPRFAPSRRLSSVRFLTYSGEEIKKMSCKKITNPNTFDSLLHPNIGGLYDSALGPCDKHDLCGTCSLNYVHCPGHMGHLPLPLPVYHPLFFMSLYQLLRSSCWVCHRLLCTSVAAHLLWCQLELVALGLLSDALTLETAVGYNDADSADKAHEGTDNIIQAMNQRLRRCKENVENGADVRSVKTKNLVDLRRHLVNEFLKYCSSGVKTCPYCSAPVRAVRQENNVIIFLKPLTRKNAGSWVAAYKKETRRQKEAMETVTSEGRKGEDDKEEDGDNSEGEGESLAAKLTESLKDSRVTSDKCTKQQFVSPLEVHEHIKSLWDNHSQLMGAIFGHLSGETPSGGDSRADSRRTADMFFLDVVPVPPSRFRPIAQLGEKRFENPQTANLHRILVDTIAIHELMTEGETTPLEKQQTKSKQSFLERLQSSWLKLQYDVNCFMDSSSDKKSTSPNGVKQILEKKEGLFRKNMMGKRVDYAARSVISPDPYINMDEIGIPMVFATRLTYPQPVTHWNVKELRQAVINGPKIHPGATHVQNEDGSVVLLSATNPRQRNAIAKRLLTPSKEGPMGGATKKVFRHLKSGDVLLLNRQPTLHKPSIMAHKARVLPGEKTLRLHYANCKSYNADFDGDEMNAHFPQNELARAEAYGIVSTHHQYLVPKDGTPLSGLIQDHVVSGLLMTIRGRLFNRADYIQLVYNALPRFSGYFKTLPPCVWKPAMLWSGKQVVSTVLLNIIPEDQDKLNLTSKAKIAPKEWGRGATRSAESGKRKKKRKKRTECRDDIMTESEVVFCQGELMCGVLDKSQFGASQYGFVHSVYELYGGAIANLLLSALGRLFTSFLQLHGFTLGVEDILVTSEANDERRKVMEECKQCGPEAAAEAFNIPSDAALDSELVSEKYEEIHRSQDGMGIKTLDFYIKKKTDHFNNLINTACVPGGLHKPFPANCLQLMVQSGAKGSTVNCMQISCLLGQIELEGQRPPLMLSGRFLPSFLPYDTSPRAGGFVDGRFLTGIRPQEYFFHCMAGREGLVDTAVKTSRSGYLQRCLIKHLEGVCVSYDLSIRDSDGSVIQFLYGEDGMDIGKTRFLSEKQFPFLINNYEALCYQLDTEAAINNLDSIKVPKYQRRLDRWVKKHGPPMQRSRPHRTAFLDFYDKHLPELKEQFSSEKRFAKDGYRTKAELEVIDMWYGMSPMARESYQKKFFPCPVPVNAHLRPDKHFGSVSEKLVQQIESFVQNNPSYLSATDDSSLSKLSEERFYTIVQFKSLRALADPGEAVGLLAAQSVGEPSTQMTLNTFHFAGRGEMNVTLGIPRLREILMTASPNIKTPAMDIPLLPTPSAREKGKRLKKLFTRVCLSEVLEKVEVWESIKREGKGHRHRLYKVKLSFLPESYYADDFDVSPRAILRYIERKFIKLLAAAVKKEVKLIKDRRAKSVCVEKNLGSGGRHGNNEQGEDQDVANNVDDNDDDDDDDDLSDLEGGEDGDATSAKQLSKKHQHTSYDDPGESDEEMLKTQTHTDGSADLSGDEEDATPTRLALTGGSHPDISDGEDETMDLSQQTTPTPMKATREMDQDRIQAAMQSSGAMVDYCYDVNEEEWCQFTLRFPTLDSKLMMTSVIGKLAPKAIVHETPSIKKGYLSESSEPGEDGVWRLKTDGVNLQVLWRYPDVLDLRKAYTNNIHAMASAYGIEAASKAIVKEISSVFRVYGIAVDHRHLSLIADYMTFDGSYKPFNRIGMEANSSPFQKMSFETTMHFLKSATIAGDSDPIKSPSACLVAGRVVNGGTGSFELLQTLC